MEARIFKSTDSEDKDVVLKFSRPNQTVLSQGDFVYREYFSKAVRAGVMTTAEANKLLVERGIWTDARAEELTELREKLSSLEQEIEGSDKNDGMLKYLEIKNLRKEIDALAQIKSSLTDNTAESVASEMRNQFYASECVVYKDTGKRVFKSLEDFLSRLDDKLTIDCYRQALISNYEQALGINVPDTFTSELVEDKWFRDISAELQREVDAEKEDTEEASEDTKEVAKKKAPRKRGRRKKTPSASA